MSVLEMRSQTGSAVIWSEVCGPEHRSASSTQHMQRANEALRPVGPARVRVGVRTVSRPATRVDGRFRVASPGPSPVSARPTEELPVVTGRRIPARVSSTGRARACHVTTAHTPKVTDDVPTWVLLTCGILFGVMMLLAMAFIGGPSYA